MHRAMGAPASPPASGKGPVPYLEYKKVLQLCPGLHGLGMILVLPGLVQHASQTVPVVSVLITCWGLMPGGHGLGSCGQVSGAASPGGGSMAKLALSLVSSSSAGA